MRVIAAIAVVFTALGSGAALAQGAPAGFVPWQSGWPASITAQPARATSPRAASAPSPARNGWTANGGRPVSVAGSAPNRARRG